VAEVAAVAAAGAHHVQPAHRLVAEHAPARRPTQRKETHTHPKINTFEQLGACFQANYSYGSHVLRAERHLEHHAASLGCPPTMGFLHFPQLAYT
jgi:hypothetical protein